MNSPENIQFNINSVRSPWITTKQDLTDGVNALETGLWCRSSEVLKLEGFDFVQFIKCKSNVTRTFI